MLNIKGEKLTLREESKIYGPFFYPCLCPADICEGWNPSFGFMMRVITGMSLRLADWRFEINLAIANPRMSPAKPNKIAAPVSLSPKCLCKPAPPIAPIRKPTVGRI